VVFFHKTYFIVATSMLVTSCAVGPDFKPPAAPKTDAYTPSPLPKQTVEIAGEEEKTQSFLIGEKIAEEWWRLFGSEPLNQLIKRSFQNNPTVQAAQASCTQAAENVKVAAGGFYPSVNVQDTTTRQKGSGVGIGFNASPHYFNQYNASVNVSYTFDIFGSLRRQVEALSAQTDYQQYELEAAYLTLTSAIVTTTIQEASIRAQIKATKELIDSQEKQLDIIRSQFRLGGTSQGDILAQSTAVAQTRATLPPLHSALAQARHALAALVGDFPGTANLPSFTLEDFHLPTELPVMLPSDLVRHRPDIKAAEALLHQASAEIGVAKAAMFPQLTLTGSYGNLSKSAGNLFAGSANVWNIASQLLQPVFRGGAMIAQENAAIAAYDQAFAQYRQTVLQAFQQVADVLQALVEEARTYKAQKEAEQSAGHALALSRKQYRLGAVSFLVLLTATRAYQQARIGRIQAEASRYASTASLFKALGGDFFVKQKQE
jgi:NodT family efflux transporter outer membrane factor (OMF) lipoprotein